MGENTIFSQAETTHYLLTPPIYPIETFCKFHDPLSCDFPKLSEVVLL